MWWVVEPVEMVGGYVGDMKGKCRGVGGKKGMGFLRLTFGGNVRREVRGNVLCR